MLNVYWHFSTCVFFKPIRVLTNSCGEALDRIFLVVGECHDICVFGAL